MEFQIVSKAADRKEADIVFLPYWQEGKKPVAAFAKASFNAEFLSLLENDFTAKVGELCFSYSLEGLEKKVLLVGLGEKSGCLKTSCRKTFSSALQFCRKKKLKNINLFLPQKIDQDSISAILDGLSMANYSYDQLKRESLKDSPTSLIKEIHLIGSDKDLKSLILRNKHLMEGVNLTRDLVNGNADEIQAGFLSEIGKGFAKKYASITCKVLGKKELEKEKMGLMLAVNRGAVQDPALIVLQYIRDPKSKDFTALVGKGITFDTGGLNLKPTGSMETMKCDMAGAAAVLGTLQACASLKIKKNVIGVIAAAENAMGSLSYKPGDVYISHSGKSVEITNTDAEGRLVLADAFSYVQKHYKVSRLIDLATLTGGVIIALGNEASGLFSNNETLLKQIEQASEVTGERVWKLPLYPEYLEALKSPIADLKNARSGRGASAGTAAMFLKQFIEKDLPWAHLDIAGTAYLSEASAYSPSLATGVGVKTLISFLESL